MFSMLTKLYIIKYRITNTMLMPTQQQFLYERKDIKYKIQGLKTNRGN